MQPHGDGLPSWKAEPGGPVTVAAGDSPHEPGSPGAWKRPPVGGLWCFQGEGYAGCSSSIGISFFSTENPIAAA
jgi:hypothetical protein